jgi:lipopolysaccharide export system protein LptA
MKRLLIVILLLTISAGWSVAVETDSETEAPDASRRVRLGSPDDDYYFEADRVVGNLLASIRTIRALGNVKLVQGTTTVTADELYYYDREKIALLKGNVVVVESERNARITGEYLEYHRESRYVIVTQSPLLTITDAAGGDVLIRGKVMEYYLDEDRGTASGDVQIDQDNLHAEGDQADYRGDDNLIVLDGDPIAWRDEDKVGGELMTMYLLDEDGGLEKMVVEGTARAVYYSASDDDSGEETAPVEDSANSVEDERMGKLELAADLMTLFYVDDAADRILCEGNATALYVPDPASGEEGTIDASAQTITIYLQDDIATQITLDGDARSIYYPDPEGETSRGRTEMNGSHMDIFLVDGELDRYVVRGDARGSYRPSTDSNDIDSDDKE